MSDVVIGNFLKVAAEKGLCCCKVPDEQKAETCFETGGDDSTKKSRSYQPPMFLQFPHSPAQQIHIVKL